MRFGCHIIFINSLRFSSFQHGTYSDDDWNYEIQHVLHDTYLVKRASKEKKGSTKDDIDNEDDFDLYDYPKMYARMNDAEKDLSLLKSESKLGTSKEKEIIHKKELIELLKKLTTTKHKRSALDSKEKENLLPLLKELSDEISAEEVRISKRQEKFDNHYINAGVEFLVLTDVPLYTKFSRKYGAQNAEKELKKWFANVVNAVSNSNSWSTSLKNLDFTQ